MARCAALYFRRQTSRLWSLVQIVEDLLQLTGVIHLDDNVRATDQLTIDVELGERQPVRVSLEALASLLVLIYVDESERLANRVHCSNDLAGKTALRKVGCAFHVQQHLV